MAPEPVIPGQTQEEMEQYRGRRRYLLKDFKMISVSLEKGSIESTALSICLPKVDNCDRYYMDGGRQRHPGFRSEPVSLRTDYPAIS
jgi:hypothetical protein